MNIKIKTVLILTLLFVVMALFWGIIGRSFLDTDLVSMDDTEIHFVKSMNVILVDDVSSAVKYYKDVFGFKLSKNLPDSVIYFMAFLKFGNSELMLRTPVSLPTEVKTKLDSEFNELSISYFEINNLNDYYESIREKCKIITGIYRTEFGTFEFIAEDQNGCMLVFGESTEN